MIKKITLLVIGFYQNFISPNLGRNCRFYPSCSEYCKKSIEKHGLINGLWLGTKRILRCNPWCQGGVDNP